MEELERSRVYGSQTPRQANVHAKKGDHLSKTPSKLLPEPADVLPPLYATVQESNPRAMSASYFSQLDTVLDQMDRLRAVMREKEIELLKARHENIERRQQKEIQMLDSQNQDAPKLIRGLRDEIAGLKQKIKSYFSQLNMDSRQIRALNDECRKLRDHGSRLETLVASQELLERKALSKQILDSSKKLMEQERVAAEALRKGEMIEKNVNNENKQLRAKMHNFEKENTFLKEKTSKLEEVVRVNKLPKTSTYTVSLESSTSVTINLTVPFNDPPNDIEYSRHTLRYSEDAGFMHEVHDVVINADLAGGHTLTSSGGVVNVDLVDLSKDGKTFTVHYTLRVRGLSSGHIYYFQIFASNEEVDGPCSLSNSLLVDALPEPPLTPTIVTSVDPLVIDLIIKPSDGTGSPPTRFQVYHSNDPNMDECFLIGEVDAENAYVEYAVEHKYNRSQQSYLFKYANPQLAVPHYFKVAAINAMGTSEFSRISDCAMLDVPPLKPTKPRLKKMNATSVSISSQCNHNAGSDIECWRILYSKSVSEEAATSHPTATTTIFTPPATLSVEQLEYLIDGLEPGASYLFSVFAINGAGESEQSDLSDEVVLDNMIPVAMEPRIDVTSPNSVLVTIPLTDSLMALPAFKQVVGYRVTAVNELLGAKMVSVVEGIDRQELRVDDLDPCE
ncbi:hypothetical protein HK101_006663 [Irineochytrium annulatum]|nr:hypothetical protein HK101_006663 [Irineochytrium annulatum]